MQHLIGISGRKQNGKDTIAWILQYISDYEHSSEEMKKRYTMKEYILNRHYFGFNQRSYTDVIHFADPLKAILSTISGIPARAFENEKVKQESNPCKLSDKDGNLYTNRQLLQLLGTECGRVIDPDMWVKCTFKWWNENSRWIIPDVRFPNEVQAIKEHGGFMIKVVRDTVASDSHISEHALDNYEGWDAVIYNDGTIEDLIDKVINLYEVSLK